MTNPYESFPLRYSGTYNCFSLFIISFQLDVHDLCVQVNYILNLCICQLDYRENIAQYVYRFFVHFYKS
nr:MAG TPA: hypothetical protein [Caudoviricetes sp.]